MAKATALKGRSLMVFIRNGTSLIPVALSTNCTISLNTETSDSKTKDDGVWGAQEISGLTWEISNESLHTVDTRTIDWTFDALTAHYKTLVRYINFEDKGMILGYGCGTPAMTRRSRYPEKAYRLGKSL